MKRADKLELIVDEFTRLRKWQKMFFKDKSKESLNTAKTYENRVDILLKKLEDEKNEMAFTEKDIDIKDAIKNIENHIEWLKGTGEVENKHRVLTALNRIIKEVQEC